MAGNTHPAPSRRGKRRARTAGARSTGSTSTHPRGQGGIAALAIAIVLAAIGYARSQLGTGGPTSGASDAPATVSADSPESGQRGDATRDARSSTAGDARVSAAEDDLLAAINRARDGRQLPALRPSAPLSRAARAHSADLQATSRCSHDGSDGSSLEDRLAAVQLELQRYGEVVACGSASAEAAVKQWLGSGAHRDILLGKDFQVVGVGVALGEGGERSKWTGVFGAP